eukprot:COSAG05_NODE_1286_length_5278_cov_4.428461_9_plen_94_part_00
MLMARKRNSLAGEGAEDTFRTAWEMPVRLRNIHTAIRHNNSPHGKCIQISVMSDYDESTRKCGRDLGGTVFAAVLGPGAISPLAQQPTAAYLQ